MEEGLCNRGRRRNPQGQGPELQEGPTLRLVDSRQHRGGGVLGEAWGELENYCGDSEKLKQTNNKAGKSCGGTFKIKPGS